MREENRSEIIHDALNLLDDEMIEEVDKLRGGVVTDEQKEFRPWRKWVALAASVCVLIMIGGIWNASIEKGFTSLENGNAVMEDMVMPEKENMQGSSIFDDEIKVGSTEAELLLKETYRLENYTQVSYLSNDEISIISEKYNETIDEFLSSVQNGTCILVDNITKVEEAQREYHLFVVLQDGSTVHLLLFGDEYVCYYEMPSVWIKVDKELYKEVVDIMENR